MARLERIDAVLAREIQLLSRHLRPLSVDPRALQMRLN